ncbi:MAG: hypothetical protein ABWZ77_01260 [Naasia sp.]
MAAGPRPSAVTILAGTPVELALGSRAGVMARLADGISRMPGRVRSLFRLAGGRWAFHWTSYAFLALPASLAVAALEAPSGFTLGEAVLTGMISVTSALLFGLVWVRLFMAGRHRKVVHPVVLIGYWASAGVGLGLARAACVTLWTDSPPDLALRLVGSISGSVTWVFAISVVQAMLDLRRERLDELELGAARIDRIRETAASNLEEQNAALARAVREAVEPHILRLRERFQALGGGLSRNHLKNLADDIQRVSGDVVRLASHRVAEPGYLPAGVSTRPRIFTPIALDVVKRPITWPWVGSLMLIVGTGPEIFRTSGLGTMLLGVGGVTAAAVLLLLVEQLTNRLRGRAATWAQWAALVAIIGGVGVVPIVVRGLGGAAVKVDTQVTPIFLFVPLVVIGTVMTSVAVAARRQNEALLRALEVQNDEVKILAHGVQLQADDVRRRVAALLHGPVQGRLSAAAMLLGLHLSQQSGRSLAEVIDETEQILEEAARDLESLALPGEASRTLDEVLIDLRSDWSGLVDVQWTIQDPVQAVLEVDVAVAATVGEIVTDMVTNAARHGRAREARLTLGITRGPAGLATATSRPAPDVPWLRILCDNDGSSVEIAPSSGGLVSALLRSMGGEWSITSGDDGVVHSLATIPLASAAAEAAVAARSNTEFSI